MESGDGQRLPHGSQPAAENHGCSFSTGLHAAVGTVTRYFNIFRISFISSEGRPGEMERTGTISGLLTRTPRPEQDLLLTPGLHASYPALPLLAALPLWSHISSPWQNLFLPCVADQVGGLPCVPTAVQIIGVSSTALETGDQLVTGPTDIFLQRRGRKSYGAIQKLTVAEKILQPFCRSSHASVLTSNCRRPEMVTT